MVRFRSIFGSVKLVSWVFGALLSCVCSFWLNLIHVKNYAIKTDLCHFRLLHSHIGKLTFSLLWKIVGFDTFSFFLSRRIINDGWILQNWAPLFEIVSWKRLLRFWKWAFPSRKSSGVYFVQLILRIIYLFFLFKNMILNTKDFTRLANLHLLQLLIRRNN